MVRTSLRLISVMSCSLLVAGNRGCFVLASRINVRPSFVSSRYPGRSCYQNKIAYHFRCTTSSSEKFGRHKSRLLLSNSDVSERRLLQSQLGQEGKNSVERKKDVTGRWNRLARRGGGAALSVLGFVASAARSIFANRKSRQWRTSLEDLLSFLEKSGIDSELASVLNVRLLDNIIILSKMENSLIENVDRRDLVALSESSQATIPTDDEALRYLKFSTAAYGDLMIRASEMSASGTFNTEWPPAALTRISEYCSIPEKDVLLLDTDYGGDTKHLRHFVAVDHTNQKVVLAIRGTFALSEVIVDAAAFSRSFCGGQAHSEMANMAERVWESSGPTVLEALRENPSYDFMITGHSLGAGAASLLNIMCHENNRSLVEGRRIRCLTYAAPPAFGPLDVVPDALKFSTNYIHEKDVVPFLSIDSIRHLSNCIQHVDELSMNWTKRMKIVSGYKEPDKTLIDAVRSANENRLITKAGAPMLMIAAGTNIWLREDKSMGGYDLKLCDSVGLAKLGILLDIRMIEDHVPSRYEHALLNLLKTKCVNATV